MEPIQQTLPSRVHLVTRIDPLPDTFLVPGLIMCYGGDINNYPLQYPRISQPDMPSYSQLVVGTIWNWHQEGGSYQGKQDRFIHNVSIVTCSNATTGSTLQYNSSQK